MTLAAFLTETAGREFEYGSWDCGKTVGRWVARRTGRDPFVDIVYATKLGWMRLAAAAGGLEQLVAGHLDALGLERTGAPRPGDVALVKTPLGVTCGVRTSTGFAVKVNDGITCGDFPLIAAWHVN